MMMTLMLRTVIKACLLGVLLSSLVVFDSLVTVTVKVARILSVDDIPPLSVIVFTNLLIVVHEVANILNPWFLMVSALTSCMLPVAVRADLFNTTVVDPYPAPVHWEELGDRFCQFHFD